MHRITYRLVVPVDFLPELLAEHTTAILFETRFALDPRISKMQCRIVNGIFLPHNIAGDLWATSDWISCVHEKNGRKGKEREGERARNEERGTPTLRGNLPTLVPPNFCTIQPCALPLLQLAISSAIVNGLVSNDT